MSQAEELLNDLTNNIGTNIISDEPHIVINPDRTITVPDELKHIAVQFDHNIETVTFDCPRYWDGHDFNEMNVYINYRRPDGYMDQYPTENLRVNDSDSSMIHFEWTISKNVTLVKGNISFLICIKTSEDEPHWNSRLNQDLVIDEGMECSEQIVESNPDVIEAILSRMEALENTGGSTGAIDYNELLNKPIERVESLDQENLVNFRDLESGQYILYGYFSPYENSDISISADNSFVSVIRKPAGSHIICLDPLNAKIVFFEILVDENEEKGFAYTRTIIPLMDVNQLLTEVGNIEDLSTDDKTNIVAAINELMNAIPSDDHIRSIVDEVLGGIVNDEY